MGGDTDGTIEIVMRMTKECGIVTETVPTSFVTENTEKRVSVLAFSKLEIHLKEQVVYCSGELIPMSHHEFYHAAVSTFYKCGQLWIFYKSCLTNLSI